VFDGYEIIINNVSNFTIKAEEGAEVKLLVDPRYAYVLSFNNCKNINISGVIAGHYPEKGSCTGGVFKFTDCSDIQIDKSDLFGCGTEGLTLTNVNNLQFNNSTIRECSYGIMTVIDSKNIAFNNSTFKQNEEYNLINIVNSDIKMDKCIINNNRTVSDWDNGMYLFSLDLYSKAIISNSTIKDNSVKRLDNGKGTITYENNIFSGNNFDVK